jgi:hypothetical protein
MLARPDDTSEDAWRLHREVVSQMSQEARVRAALDLSESVRAIQIEGLLARNPGWSRVDAVRHLVLKQMNVELPGVS